MPLLYHAYVYLEFLILACTIYILAPFRSDRAEERAKQNAEKRDEKKERPSLKERLAEKKNDVINMDADRKQLTADKKKEEVI